MTLLIACGPTLDLSAALESLLVICSIGEVAIAPMVASFSLSADERVRVESDDMACAIVGMKCARCAIACLFEY